MTGIYVKSFEFDRDGVYAESDLQAVRDQLKAPWARIVNVQSSRSREAVEVYAWSDGGQPGGLAVLVAEPRQLTIVNIVGAVDLTKLAALGGQFGIPVLPGTPPPNTSARPR